MDNLEKLFVDKHFFAYYLLPVGIVLTKCSFGGKIMNFCDLKAKFGTTLALVLMYREGSLTKEDVTRLDISIVLEAYGEIKKRCTEVFQIGENSNLEKWLEERVSFETTDELLNQTLFDSVKSNPRIMKLILEILLGNEKRELSILHCQLIFKNAKYDDAFQDYQKRAFLKIEERYKKENLLAESLKQVRLSYSGKRELRIGNRVTIGELTMEFFWKDNEFNPVFFGLRGSDDKTMFCNNPGCTGWEKLWTVTRVDGKLVPIDDMMALPAYDVPSDREVEIIGFIEAGTAPIPNCG